MSENDDYEARRRRVLEQLDRDGAIDLPQENYIVELGPERGFLPGSFVDMRTGAVFALTMSDSEIRNMLVGTRNDPWPYATLEEKREALARMNDDRAFREWCEERGIEL